MTKPTEPEGCGSIIVSVDDTWGQAGHTCAKESGHEGPHKCGCGKEWDECVEEKKAE